MENIFLTTNDCRRSIFPWRSESRRGTKCCIRKIPTMPAEAVGTKLSQVSEQLCASMTECVGCGVALQYSSLAYKQCCPKVMDEAEQAAASEAKIKTMQFRAAKSLGKRKGKEISVTNQDGHCDQHEQSTR